MSLLMVSCDSCGKERFIYQLKIEDETKKVHCHSCYNSEKTEEMQLVDNIHNLVTDEETIL